MGFVKMCRFGVVALALGVGVAGLTSFAQPDEPEPVSESTQALERVDAAYQMIDLGRRTSSPEALLAAAVLLHNNPLTEIKEKAEDAETVPSVKPKDLLEEAKGMRPKDKALAEYIAKLADDFKEEARGALNFRGGTYQIAPGKTAKVSILFKGKAPAAIRVLPGGTTFETRYVTFPLKVGGKTLIQKKEIRIPVIPQFHVKVTDMSGKAVYDRKGPTHSASFLPAKQGAYLVQVTNVTKAASRVVVTSN